MSQNVWATIMPFGQVTNFLLAQIFFSGWLALISGTVTPLGFLLQDPYWLQSDLSLALLY
jgi:hypothetical protein